MIRREYKPGEPVVYRVTKCTPHPGPRAEDIHPAPRGENYTYQVDKFWVVEEVLPGGKLRLRTRQGKEHEIDAHDPRLHHATWWERLLYRQRFPKPRSDNGASGTTTANGSWS
jgi:hypothetical protein